MADETDVSVGKTEDKDRTKAEKIEEERQDLLERVSSYNVRAIKHKVAWVLNHFPDTRDSDITLQLRYWTTFQSQIYTGGMIDPGDLYRLTRLTSLKRARAKIQNEYRLFQASSDVRRRRGPVSSIYAVYMDDSGKHGDYLIVGSVWFLAEFPYVFRALRKLGQDFGREFHFAHATRQHVPWYMRLVDTLSSQADALSFKYISVPRRGLKGDDPFTDLYYHLLVEGIVQEDETGRAPLPRRLQSWIDTEESLIDRLRLANLEDRLAQACSARFAGKLVIDRLNTVNSKTSVPSQVSDLIAASVNRILSSSGRNKNHKDQIAEYACEKLGLEPGLDPNEWVGDIAVHIVL